MAGQRIETDRLILRRWQDSDRTPYAEICADTEVMRYIGNGSTRSAEQASRGIDGFEAAWNENGFGLFALELRDSGTFAGFCGLARPDFMPELLPATEIGWRLGRQYWGKGLASEAAVAALQFAREHPAVGEIVSICQAGNHASVRIMEKIGLAFDREAIDPTCERDVLVYRDNRAAR